MFLVHPPYLQNKPDLKAILLTMTAFTAVTLPLLLQLPLGVVGVFTLFLLGRLILLWFGVLSLKSWQLMVLMFCMAGLVFQQLGTVVGLEGGAAFLLLLALLKSYEGKTRRDWQVLIVAMLFLLAAAILFDQGLLMGGWTLLCLVLMTMSLAVLNELDFQAAFRQSVLGFLLALLPMVVLFVGMPRRETPFWGVPQLQNGQANTGMSDTMKPGSISNLVQSNEPAFSVTFDNGYVPKQKDLYWRVMILAHHNGQEWEAMRDFADHAKVAFSPETVHYHVMLEDDKGRIPALDYPVHDASPQRGVRYEAGDVARVWSKAGVRRIALQSTVSDELPHKLDKFMQQRYRKLPANLNPRTHALAQQLWQQAGGNIEAFIQATYLYFRQQNFIYTLKPPLLTGLHTTDEFLFQSRQGFCEHYADAFVMLMRAAGVSARVVAGYQGGEYNADGDFWQVRSKDAHAWAEVWLPEKQVWKRIDPTSAVSADRIEMSIDEALSDEEVGSKLRNNRFTQYFDQGRYYWQRWIVDYDSKQQRNLFKYLGFEHVSPVTLVLLLLVGMVLALIPLWLWWRRNLQREISPLEHGFLLLKRQILGDKNNLSIASLAPNEFRAYLSEQNRLPEDLAQLLDDYIQICYAQSEPPSLVQAEVWYQRAKQLAKKYRYKADD